MKIFNQSILLLAGLSLVLFGCGEDDKVIGLNSATKYGSISITMEGTRLDGEAFKATKVFKFMPEEGPDNSSVFFDGAAASFYVQRQHGAVGNSHNDNLIQVYFYTSSDVPTQANISFNTSILASDDVFFYVYDAITIGPENITAYSYNEDTGKLKFSFKGTVPAISSSTDHDLSIKGTVSVTVFENVGNDIEF
jgi:hypothetical protein